MKTIKVKTRSEIPNSFTGITEWLDGTKEWRLNGRFVYVLRKPIGDYIVIEDGLPSTMDWLGKPVPTLKVLTAEGICFIPNLPGI